jgi:3-oxoacyl-[acyl-carrier-protein] synthase-3
MKKFSLLVIVAAVAMVSCSNTYEGKTVELTNMNDSVNYALGLVNANGIKMQQFRNIDSTEYKAATTAFMDGLIKGYETEVQEEPSEIQGVAQNIGYAVKEMEKSGLAKDEVDRFVFHQANNFINSYIAKKMKLDPAKMPSTIAKFGSTSSVSVPLTIVSELKDKLKGNKTLLLSAFGVGMTWATGILPLVDCHISDIVEVKEGRPVL